MAKSVCFGAGLLALDVILNGHPDSPAYLTAGGSCGNVLAVLSFLGFNSNPIARLANDKAAKEIVKDLALWKVNSEFITKTEDGSTPIIIHRILKDKLGKPKHRFEFKDPESKAWLPQYKPLLASSVRDLDIPRNPSVFYFDRASRATIDLAERFKNDGALVFFEPPSMTDMRLFQQAAEVADVIKFSSDRINNFDQIFPEAVAPLEVRTLGIDGLEFRSKHLRRTAWEKVTSIPLPQDLVVDSAGAGDWCSAGIILTLLSYKFDSMSDLTRSQLVNALNVGQSYSAVNICFIGARGAMYELTKTRFTNLSKNVTAGDFGRLRIAVKDHGNKLSINAHKHLKISTLYE